MGTILKTTAEINLIIDGVYGEIHVHDNVVAQTMPTGVYTKYTVWTDNGESSNTTPNEANGEITLDEAGTYKVECSLSFGSGTSNVAWTASAFLDGVEQDQIHLTRKVSVASDIGSASFTGFLVATAGQKIDLRFRHDNPGDVDITVVYGNLNCHLVELG